MTVFVVAEAYDGAPTVLTRELLGLARDLAGEGSVAAVVFADQESAAAGLIAAGADRVFWCEHAEEYEGEVWVPEVAALARELSPHTIFAGHTPAGADLAPRLAFRLDGAIATGCIGVAFESDKLMFTRACYGGNVRETISFSSAPAIATVKSGVGRAQADVARCGDIIRVEVSKVARRARVIAREREASSNSLENARTIIAGGRGLEGPEGFEILGALAAMLGDAAVGSSRVPCDLGWCPHSWQIGLTGKTVTPELYIAVGISGAGHHMAGCGNARTIVAINSDPGAAIFKEARFGVVGDYRKVVPAMTEAVRALEAIAAPTREEQHEAHA